MLDEVRDVIRQIRRFRYAALYMFAAGAALLIFSAGLWYLGVYKAPRNVFADMLARNLRTDAVVMRQVSGEINGLTIDKRSDMQFGTDQLIRIKATTVAVETGTSVSTETIADTSQEYNRYRAIKTGEGSNPVNTGEIMDKWAEGASGSTAFSQTLLRPYSMPMGQLPADVRAKMAGAKPADEIFKTDYSKVERGSLEGRPTYTYDVRINPEKYVSYLKIYAEALSLRELDSIDPADARQTEPVPVKLTVDVASRRLVAADYPKLKFKETFSDYNVPRDISRPKPQVSAEALRALVSDIR